MKPSALKILIALLCVARTTATDIKQPLRAELAERQTASGYFLADVGWPPGEVQIVSLANRTETKTQAKNPQQFKSSDCFSADGRYSLSYQGGIMLRDNQSGETQQIESDVWFSKQCFSAENKFVYSSRHTIRIYDVTKKQGSDVASGDYPSWSPDGKWIGFDSGKQYTMLNLESSLRKSLFKTKGHSDAIWSPDSLYLTYTEPGGNGPGIFFWRIECPDSYRVWIWRVEDGAHDWVQQICKPPRTFVWIKASDLAPH